MRKKLWSKDGKVFLWCGWNLAVPGCDCNSCRWERWDPDVFVHYRSLEEAMKDRSDTGWPNPLSEEFKAGYWDSFDGKYPQRDSKEYLEGYKLEESL